MAPVVGVGVAGPCRVGRSSSHERCHGWLSVGRLQAYMAPGRGALEGRELVGCSGLGPGFRRAAEGAFELGSARADDLSPVYLWTRTYTWLTSGSPPPTLPALTLAVFVFNPVVGMRQLKHHEQKLLKKVRPAEQPCSTLLALAHC